MRVSEAYDKFKEHLTDALEDEHCHGTCDATCDIHFAFEKECYLWAAHLLTGATECPKTVAVMDCILAWSEVSENDKQFDDALQRERKELVQNDHWVCSGCGSVNWTDDYTAACGNCGADCKGATPGDWQHACGDIDPWDHIGGYVDMDTATLVHLYPFPEEEDKDNIERRRWSVNEIDVDGSVGDIEDFDLEGAAKCCGLFECDDEEVSKDPVAYLKAPFLVDLDTLEGEERKKNILRRVGTYETIASFCGWGELSGGNEQTLSKREILEKWELPA